MVEVDAKKSSTNILIVEVERESAIAATETEAATIEEESVNIAADAANK